MPRTLHIADGDSTAGTLRLAGFGKNGKILSWRDALYTGPVPADLTHRQLSRLRSRFWTNGKRATEFDQRDAIFAAWADYYEVVLWFSPDCTLCQLSLSQILASFHEQKRRPERLFWVQVHGGELKPDQIANAHATRTPVTLAQVRLASLMWRTFRSLSPMRLGRLTESDLRTIPGVRKAILWILQEYPSKRNGLSRLERALLRVIEHARTIKVARTIIPLFLAEYVGDLYLLDCLRGLVTAPQPLLRFAEPFTGDFHNHEFNAATLALTGAGHNVFAGKADHIALNGIDRWIGGVYLRGRKVRWRWDEHQKRVVTAR